jgi:hypothetical protein
MPIKKQKPNKKNYEKLLGLKNTHNVNEVNEYGLPINNNI